MYYIQKITFDEKGQKLNPQIIDHTNGTISVALALLEECVRSFILTECGNQAAKDMKIIDIKGFNQVCEPLIDTILVYRHDVDPHTLHLFQRKSKVVPGWAWGESAIKEFKQTEMFIITEYNKISTNEISNSVIATSPSIEMIQVGRITIPKKFTQSPMCDLINQLKKNERFQKRKIMEN